MNRIYKKLGIWIAVLALSPIVTFAATSYSVTNGAAPSVTEWGACKVVTNNSGKQVFVPTNSSAEWSAFYNHPPAGVSAVTCCVPSQATHVGCYNNQMWSIDDSCNTPVGILDGCSGSYCSTGSQVVTYTGCSGTLAGGSCSAYNTNCGYACVANGASSYCASCAPNSGQACSSAANACGQTGSGTYDCAGNCNATTPNGWCNTCQSPAANTWYVDYGVELYWDGSCYDYYTWESGTVAGEYWTWVEPNHAALTNSIDQGNACFYFSHAGMYARAYSRSPIYDNGGSWYYNNCGVCGGGGTCP